MRTRGPRPAARGRRLGRASGRGHPRRQCRLAVRRGQGVHRHRALDRARCCACCAGGTRRRHPQRRARACHARRRGGSLRRPADGSGNHRSARRLAHLHARFEACISPVVLDAGALDMFSSRARGASNMHRHTAHGRDGALCNATRISSRRMRRRLPATSPPPMARWWRSRVPRRSSLIRAETSGYTTRATRGSRSRGRVTSSPASSPPWRHAVLPARRPRCGASRCTRTRGSSSSRSMERWEDSRASSRLHSHRAASTWTPCGGWRSAFGEPGPTATQQNLTHEAGRRVLDYLRTSPSRTMRNSRLIFGIALAMAWAPYAGAQQASTVPGFATLDSIEARVQGCVTCHGHNGQGTNSGYFPRIAGKPAGYLYNQLIAFRDGTREYPPMNYLVAYLPDAYLREMAELLREAAPAVRGEGCRTRRRRDARARQGHRHGRRPAPRAFRHASRATAPAHRHAAGHSRARRIARCRTSPRSSRAGASAAGTPPSPTA